MSILHTDSAPGVSPLGHELRIDSDGSARDEILALFESLVAQASHALRKPLLRDQFDLFKALLDAAALGSQIVDDYWRQNHHSD